MWRKCGLGRPNLYSVSCDLASSFDSMDLSLVRRGGNAIVDALARRTFSLLHFHWIEEILPGLLSLFQHDVLTSMSMTIILNHFNTLLLICLNLCRPH